MIGTKLSITLVLSAVLVAGVAVARDEASHSGPRTSWTPDPDVTASTYVQPRLETSQNDRVAAVIASLPESLRLAGSGITIRESCGGQDPCISGAWYQGVMYLGPATLEADDGRLARVMAHEYGHVWSAVHVEESSRLKAMIEPLTDQNPEEALADCVKVALGHGHTGYWSCDDSHVREAVRSTIGL